MKKAFTISLLLLCTTIVFCQSQLITIKLIDKNNDPIIGANTAFKERLDTTKVQFGKVSSSRFPTLLYKNTECALYV
jgi:hypothetical protein